MSNQPYQLSPTELFNTLMISSGTITHRIDRLEQADLVKRIPDPSFRRGTLVQLTDKGFNAIRSLLVTVLELATGVTIVWIIRNSFYIAQIF